MPLRCQTSISIHALLAESDRALKQVNDGANNFYPRSPCGERHVKEQPKYDYPIFLSTLSLRRATPNLYRTHQLIVYFYPRSPCGERRRRCPSGTLSRYFYPRSPCGERHMCYNKYNIGDTFLSTLSLRRATAKVHKTVGHFCAEETHFMESALPSWQ